MTIFLSMNKTKKESNVNTTETEVVTPELERITESLKKLENDIMRVKEKVQKVHQRFYRHLQNDQANPINEKHGEPETFIEHTLNYIRSCDDILADTEKYINELTNL